MHFFVIDSIHLDTAVFIDLLNGTSTKLTYFSLIEM